MTSELTAVPRAIDRSRWRAPVTWRPARVPGGRRRWVLPLCVGVLVVLVLFAVVVPWVAGIDPRQTALADANQAPSWDHWFGTDQAGRDLVVRVAEGLRVSLLVAAVCAVVATVLGCVVGLTAAVVGGRTDRVLMRTVDGLNAVPHLLLGIVIAAMWKGAILAVIASIALTHWTQVARIVRAQALTVRTRDYVLATVSLGGSRRQVLVRHLLPAVAPQALLSVALLLPHAVWHESALSFLGVGLPPDRPSLGTLLEDARTRILVGQWWTLVFPSLALIATTAAVAGLSAAARDRLLPHRRTEVGVGGAA
ncbi:ABC transporter permease [Nakamurella leprariae]|uniref:ABC transporter permease n=1 Tax=Nakamurella leprariae TaxID=2803911 RepID=A0A939C344_9ACTN|nr:ABC transporter permease [Nakamurella leprariae]MBM9468732.1 ABC transporter permease [Nakamurella leprariae]